MELMANEVMPRVNAEIDGSKTSQKVAVAG
jgi:hypothetical protein